MKFRFLLISLVIATARLFPAEAPPDAVPKSPDSPAIAELKAVVAQVQVKVDAGKNTAADFADELGSLQKLFAKYRGQKNDDVAQILWANAIFYMEVVPDNDKALQLLRQVKLEFPNTDFSDAADKAIENIEDDIKSAKTREAIIGKKAPELNFQWSTRSGLKKLSGLKGKVVVLDFWATWCAPCVASFPDMRELVAHYQDLDVVVLGVTSLQGAIVGLEPMPIDTRNDPTKEYSVMKDYVKAKEMTWPVAFSTEKLFNPEYGVHSIPYLAIIAPDGTVRHAGLHPGTPAEETYAKIDAILKEFSKKLPVAASPKK